MGLNDYFPTARAAFTGSITSHYVQRHWENCQLFTGFWHRNYHILQAYVGLYRTPARWYGQKPYLEPTHISPWRNMVVWDEAIALTWGGITNAHLKFSLSHGERSGKGRGTAVFRAAILSHIRPKVQQNHSQLKLHTMTSQCGIDMPDEKEQQLRNAGESFCAHELCC